MKTKIAILIYRFCGFLNWLRHKEPKIKDKSLWDKYLFKSKMIQECINSDLIYIIPMYQIEAYKLYRKALGRK